MLLYAMLRGIQALKQETIIKVFHDFVLFAYTQQLQQKQRFKQTKILKSKKNINKT